MKNESKFIDPPLVSDAVLLTSVMALGRQAFEIAAKHPDLVLLLDLTTNATDLVRLDDLPATFTMAARVFNQEAIFCVDDFRDLCVLKAETTTNTEKVHGHYAVPVFIAPKRLHQDQKTAIIAIVWWDAEMKFPSTNLSLVAPS
jgi:hypothetical protein